MLRIVFGAFALLIGLTSLQAAEPPGQGEAAFTHVVVRETEYYTTGPQQGRPADGRFREATKVRLLRDAGSYAQVQAAGGLTAFVATTALKPIGKGEPPMITQDAKTLAQSNNRFAADLYARLSEKEGNLFFSAYSISTALAMTYAGAEGQTEKQMAEVLRFSLPEQHLHAAFASLRASSHPADGKTARFQLRVANRLWGQRGYHFLPEFQETVKANYGGELAPVDFAGQAEAARQTINAWVETETEQKIRDLIPSGMLDATTRLVLTNAIYFKGAWTEEFKKEATKDAPFHATAQEQVSVPMMQQTHRFRYGETADVQILELPYGKSRDLSMIVLLPKEIGGLAKAEALLDSEKLQESLAALRSREVHVFLPRFKMTSQFQLKDVLVSMGMPLAFSRQADFSGISTEEPLHISAVVHKAFVDVNEEGTEAAAATAVGIRVTAAPRRDEPVVFKADRPFVFLIRDNRSGSLLFVGRLMNPQA
jgi:serpin B